MKKFFTGIALATVGLAASAIPADAITYRAGSGDSPDSDQAARAGMSVLSEFILPSETGYPKQRVLRHGQNRC